MIPLGAVWPALGWAVLLIPAASAVSASPGGPHVFLPAHPHGGRSPRVAGEEEPQGATTFQASVRNSNIPLGKPVTWLSSESEGETVTGTWQGGMDPGRGITDDCFCN